MVQDIGDRHANMVLLAGQAIDRATLQGLKAASAKSGVSFHYLVAKAAQESSLDPTAKADSSSAVGLFQFTRGTWLDMVKRYGSQYGFADLSRQILETPSGKLTVTDAAAEKRIQALRQDPETSGLMAAEYARDNAAALESALDRAPDAADLYLAHFLGPNGAVTLLNAEAQTPGREAADVVPAAARANPAVFTAADGAPRTVAQVVKLIRDRFSTQMNRFAAADTVMSDTPAIGPSPAAPVATPPSARASNGALDFRSALGGDPGRSPVSAMIMDQLIRLIASGPMMPAVEDEDEDDEFRPLSSGGFRGGDWADVMSRAFAPQATAPTPPEPAARAYNDAAEPAPPRALNDTI
jgi:hypothetical protein